MSTFLNLVGVEDDAGVDDLCVDAVQLLVFEAGLDVVDAGAGELVAELADFAGVRAAEIEACLEEAGDDQAVLAVAQIELRADVLAEDHVRRFFAEALDQRFE